MHFSFRHYRAEGDSHAHSDFHQIIISDIGVLELDVAGRGGRVSGRTIAFVPSGERHAFRASGPNRFAVIDIDECDICQDEWSRICEKALGAGPYLQVPRGRQAHISGFFDGLACWSRQMPIGNGTDLKAQLIALLGMSRTEDGNDLGMSQPMPARLYRTLVWAEARLAEPLTVSDMAGVAVLSESALHEAFKRYLGQSPMRWLMNCRLDAAYTMLVTDIHEELHNIKDIAAQVGFTNQSAFSRAFSRKFGVVPRQARSIADR
ncbi:AraC family transcriptional regulator [Thalassospira sp. MA62]|nr:AraC family transcriptional regulator [Thalassospira sp. MA62]